MSVHAVMNDSHSSVVATFETYEEAEALVDRMADTGFPVEHIAIIGRGVYILERVTGRFTALRAALYGALSGASFGSLLGVLFGALFADDGGEFLASWLYWLCVGAVFMAVFALAAFALLGGRRNFSSLRGITASHYDVAVDQSAAGGAERWLAQQGTERRDSVSEPR